MNHLKEEWEYIKSIQYIPLKNLKRNLVKSRLNKLKFEYIKDVLICILSLKSNNIKSFLTLLIIMKKRK